MLNLKEIHVISLGAGVQSSTMALMAAKGLLTPMPSAAIFADTGDEPKNVYDWLNILKPKLEDMGIPVIITRYREDITLSQHSLELKRSRKSGNLYQRGGVPLFVKNDEKVSMLMRTCTGQFKIRAIQREMRKLTGKFRPSKNEVICWIGISTEEASRMKDSVKPWVVNRYPLIELEMSRKDCLKWMTDNGFQEPPKSACVYCPYRDNKSWLEMKTNHPDDFNQAVKYEEEYQKQHEKSEVSQGDVFIHRSCVPLKDVDFQKHIDLKEGKINMFNNECEGMCGV